jgi:hypothetical protein
MKIKFAIREVKSFETRTPLGPKRISIYTKTGEIEEEIPDDIADDVKEVPDFASADIIVEGSGLVWIDMGNGQRHPQNVSFRFPDEITTVEQAYERFDEFFKKEIELLQEEEKKARNSIAIPSDMDMQALSGNIK